MINATKKTTTSGYIKGALFAASLTVVSSMAHSFSATPDPDKNDIARADKQNVCNGFLSTYKGNHVTSTTIKEDMDKHFAKSFRDAPMSEKALDQDIPMSFSDCISAIKTLHGKLVIAENSK